MNPPEPRHSDKGPPLRHPFGESIELGPKSWVFTNHFRNLVARRYKSWAEAARALGVRKSNMSQYANGLSYTPTAATIARWLDVMGFTLEDLTHALDPPPEARPAKPKRSAKKKTAK